MTTPPIFWILVFTGILGIGFLVYEKHLRRIDRRYEYLPRTALTLLIWIFAYAAEVGLTDKNAMLLAANIQFIGIGSAPYLLYATIRQFIGRPIPNRRLMILSTVIPILTVAAAFTDGKWGLLRDSVEVVELSGMTLLNVDYSWWHNWVFVPFQYVFYFAAIATLFDAIFRSPRIFRSRLLFFILGLILPLLGSLVYVIGFPPFDTFNPTCLMILFSFVIFGTVMLRAPLRDIVPLAKDRVLDSLEEGVIILDLDDRILEYNITASSMLWELSPSAVGKDVAESLGSYDALLMLARGVERNDAGFILTDGGRQRHCLAQAVPVIGFDGRRIGRIITINDITSRVDKEPKEIVLDKDDKPQPLPRREFFRETAAEFERASRYSRSVYILALILPDWNSAADILSIASLAADALKPWERLCYAGSGVFLISVPEAEKDIVYLKGRDMLRILREKHEDAKVGIAAHAPGRDEGLEEVVARARRAALRSRKGLAFLEG